MIFEPLVSQTVLYMSPTPLFWSVGHWKWGLLKIAKLLAAFSFWTIYFRWILLIDEYHNKYDKIKEVWFKGRGIAIIICFYYLKRYEK